MDDKPTIKSRAHINDGKPKQVRTPRPKKSDHPAYTDRAAEAHRPGAPFISFGGQEYIVKNDGQFWIIVRWQGGRLSDDIKGRFMSKGLAEEALISHLRHTDRGSRARWPGKESSYGPFNGE